MKLAHHSHFIQDKTNRDPTWHDTNPLTRIREAFIQFYRSSGLGSDMNQSNRSYHTPALKPKYRVRSCLSSNDDERDHIKFQYFAVVISVKRITAITTKILLAYKETHRSNDCPMTSNIN